MNADTTSEDNGNTATKMITHVLNLEDPFENENNIIPLLVPNELVEIQTAQGVQKKYTVSMLKLFFNCLDTNDLLFRKFCKAIIAEDGRAIYLDVPQVQIYKNE